MEVDNNRAHTSEATWHQCRGMVARQPEATRNQAGKHIISHKRLE